MLDSETRRRIDSARDQLVGKVPDPKAQVEQITIALIYKFMDDLDAESEALGGERAFFAGNYARYGWAELTRPGLGGHETLSLYAEGLTRIPENPGVPPLFRRIFKNAFLPYRDPETLRGFLKIIDEFAYDHSERLGDAFEYLLSILGSQGDAGQFRTPRHIIEFMVRIIDPKKGETVLDPACGTAGFLVSAHKHILKANTDAEGNSALAHDEKKRLAENIRGCDISPDMVRLSLVNLYLHGFAAPGVGEYDTLTSEDRWNELADVILANPPFMSPKGGIRPHRRFSVQSKRSEVLFADYIAEHLTPQGRAAVIVPEGIIFQSQNAHKQLRKMLVRDYLVAVVSLPAGVFNPYSGVKTSILVMDKRLAKKSGVVGFFKVENDGFDLGKQRRPVGKNDLPQACEEIAGYLEKLRSREPLDGFKPGLGRVVPKEKIAADGEYNLSGERYLEINALATKFSSARIADICVVNPPKSEIKNISENTLISFVPMAYLNEHRISFRPVEKKKLGDVLGSYTYFRNNDVLLAKVTPCFENGKAGIARGLVNDIGFGSSEYYVFRSKDCVLPEWIYFCLMHPIFRSSAIDNMTGTGGLQRVPRKFIEDYQIPLPPLETQKEIVAEIECCQKIIDGARAVVDNYRPQIAVDPNWPMVELGEVFKKSNNTVHPSSLNKPTTYIGLENITQNSGEICGEVIVNDPSIIKSLKNVFAPAEILFGKLRPNLNKVWLANQNGICSTDIFVIQPKENKVITPFYAHIFRDSRFNKAVLSQLKGAQLPRIGWSCFAKLQIPLPSLETQKEIVAEIEAEQALVNANRKLIGRFEKKIQSAVARVWSGQQKSISPRGPDYDQT